MASSVVPVELVLDLDWGAGIHRPVIPALGRIPNLSFPHVTHLKRVGTGLSGNPAFQKDGSPIKEIGDDNRARSINSV